MSGTIAWIEAHSYGDQCGGSFGLREDFAQDLLEIRREIEERGGLLTSSGGLRSLAADVSAARSPVSLHYLGRAIDLCIWSGMQGPADPYVIVRDDAATSHQERPFWRIWCRTSSYGVSASRQHGVIWRPGEGSVGVSRAETGFDLTALFEARGWSRVPARPGWLDSYLCVEWWHFERRDGFVSGVSTFGDELRRLYGAGEIAASRLGPVLERVWNGWYFASVDPVDLPR